MGLARFLLKVVLYCAIVFVALLLLGGLLGVALPLLTWSVMEAASGSFASAQIPLSIWTLGTALAAFVFRLWFLRRQRCTHLLRPLEYLGHLFRPSILTGGIAYGVMAVLTAFMKGLFAEAELAKLSPPVSVAPGILLGFIPLVIAMLAAILTVEGILKSIPESKEPTRDEKDLLGLWAFVNGGWKDATLSVWRRFHN